MEIKRKIAYEIVIFFAAVTLVILFIVGNYIWNASIKRTQEQLTSRKQIISYELANLPENHIENLHKRLQYKMFISFKVGEKKYVIPRQDEKEFLNNFPNAVKLDPDPQGYIYKKDSMVAIELVSYSEFKELILKESYKNKLLQLALEEKVVSSMEEFDRLIKEGLLFKENRKWTLNQELNKNASQLQSCKQNILEKDKIIKNSKIFALILFVLIYPLRFSVIIIKWAVKILKK